MIVYHATILHYSIRYMTVIEHQKGAWFLVSNGTDYFLDVNCTHRFASFSFLLKLEPQELHQFKIAGINFIHLLAEEIQDEALGIYAKRNVIGGTLAKSVQQAIRVFNKQNSGK